MGTLYAHCAGLNVTAGDEVERGDLVAWVGSTGFSSGPHLHFEVWIDGARADPAGFLSLPFEREGYRWPRVAHNTSGQQN